MFDFTARFPMAKCDGFLTQWPIYQSIIMDILKENYNQSVNTMWSNEIEGVLALVKLLPAKAGKKAAGQILPFTKAIDKLIVHSVVNFIQLFFF